MTFVEPLDLQRIFINNLAGSIEIFIFLAFIAIGAACSLMRIPNTVTMILLLFFGIILAGVYPAMYVLVVLIAGLAITKYVSKFITR